MKSLVIIPTYNEKENIEELTAKILATDPRLEILIVDDNSPDGTGQTAEKLAAGSTRVHILHRPQKMGLGTAYIAGFKYALSKHYDLIFEMDADNSHDPKYLPDFLNSISDYDLVIGSRYLHGGNVVNWPMHRLLLSYLANIYARWITGLPLHDSTSGFKCFRRHVLEAINLDRIGSEGYAFQIEMNFICWKKGFRLHEIPIVFVDRLQGKTKMSKKIIFEAVLLVWKLRLKGLFGKI